MNLIKDMLSRGIGLALGGGAAKGFFHLGLLRVLEREKIPILAIAGTSMGAIIGGMYAIRPDIKNIETRIFTQLEKEGFRQLDRSSEEHLPFEWKSYQNIKNMLQKLGELMPDHDFKEVKIPFVAIASDIYKAKKVVIKKGSITDAMIASSRVPGILPPVKMGDNYLVDGIIYDNVPAAELRKMGINKILAVHVTPNIQFKDPPKGNIDVLIKSFLCMFGSLSRGSADEADMVIDPDLDKIPYGDFRYAKLCADIGEKVAEENLREICKLAGGLKYLFKNK